MNANMTFTECHYGGNNMETTEKTKFCKHCGAKIPEDAVLCTACGRQVEKLEGQNTPNTTPNIVINNANSSQNINTNANFNGMYGIRMCNKWIALALCFFGGIFGFHKFYEGKIGMGVFYLCTFGFFGIGVVIDFIVLLAKPNPYIP